MIKFIKTGDVVKKPVSHLKDKVKEVILQDGEIPGLLQFARAKFNKGDEIESHSHESMYEVFYVIRGEVNVSGNGKSEVAREGDTFVVPPLQNHSLAFNQETEMIYFNISQD